MIDVRKMSDFLVYQKNIEKSYINLTLSYYNYLNGRRNTMSYSMFYGNEKDLYREFDIVVEKFEDTILAISERGIPSFVSFDASLGYYLARWLVNASVDGLFKFPQDFSFCVHNGDAVDRNLIEALLNNYLHFQVPLLLDDVLEK